MSEAAQASDTRPTNTSALTPDQIAQQLGGTPQQMPQQTPQQMPQQTPQQMPQQQFNVGAFAAGNSPQDMAQENAMLKQQIAQQAVFNAAGGQDKFQAMSAWAATGRTPQQNAELNIALNNPNVPDSLRAMAVRTAMQEYEAAMGAGNAQLVNGDAGIPPGGAHGITPQVEPIGKDEYHARYVGLRRAGKDMYSPEMRELDKQRLLNIKASR